MIENERKKSAFLKAVKRDRQHILMVLVPVLSIVAFHYLPMFGVLYGFQDVGRRSSFWENEWVGLKWFEQFFANPMFGRYIKNTFVISVSNLIAGTLTSIVLTLIINEVKDGKFKRITQSLTYFPNFVSLTVLVGLMTMLLEPTTGSISKILQDVFGMRKTDFFMEKQYFLPLYVISGLWQSAGWSTIIYLGAISGIDPTLYEAASIDGCGRIRRIWHITLEGMKPVIVTLLVLNIGSMLNVGYQKILLMQTTTTMEVSDVISTHVYHRGIEMGEFGYGAAVGLFNSVINVILLLTANRLAKKLTETSLF